MIATDEDLNGWMIVWSVILSGRWQAQTTEDQEQGDDQLFFHILFFGS